MPFELHIQVGPGLLVSLPEDEVLREDVRKLTHDANSAALRRYAADLCDGDGARPSGSTTPPPPSPALSEIVQLGPSLVSSGPLSSMRRLMWSSATGLARGTLVRVRLAEAAMVSDVAAALGR